LNNQKTGINKLNKQIKMLAGDISEGICLRAFFMTVVHGGREKALKMRSVCVVNFWRHDGKTLRVTSHDYCCIITITWDG
jgi:hypothetical protein